MTLTKIQYEYMHPLFKSYYAKQEEHNPKFHFRNTFEIYNHKEDLYEVYNPTLINYTFHHIKDYDIKNSCYYILRYSRVNKIGSLPKLNGLDKFLIENIKVVKKTEYIQYRDRFDTDYELILRDRVMNYLNNGNYYETTINDYIKDNKITIRPINNTSGYSFNYDPNMIKNNYWVQKAEIEIIEDI
jgi:hypothetical protein